jgi:phage anti-repressor protein
MNHEGGVTRFYFHLHNDIDSLDEEGRELNDIASAREVAIAYAREMAALSVREKGHLDRRHRIDVADGAGHILFSVGFGEIVEIRG